MLLVQLSDLHILEEGKVLSGVVETDRLLVACVAAIARLDPQPDAVLITGDLVDSGKPAEYLRLRALLAPLQMPIFVLPGNHDEVSALRAAFSDHPYLPLEGPLNWTSDALPVRLVGLDSTVTGYSGGRLPATTLEWLDRILSQQPSTPTIVALHHPPFESGIRHMDRIALDDPAGLAEVVARHPQVERVVAGHIHRSIQTRFAGTVASTCPGSAHQIACDLRIDHIGAFTLEPPAFQLHHWNRQGQLVTHLVPVGDFSAAYAF